MKTLPFSTRDTVFVVLLRDFKVRNRSLVLSLFTGGGLNARGHVREIRSSANSVAILDELVEDLGRVRERKPPLPYRPSPLALSFLPDLPLTRPIWRPDLLGFESRANTNHRLQANYLVLRMKLQKSGIND